MSDADIEIPAERQPDFPAWMPGAALVAIALIAYLPAIGGDFIWDDDDHVTENVTLRSLAGLARIWTQPRSIPQYYPLTHTTFWLEYQLWGPRPLGYHLVNVLLHGGSAVLLWRILRRLDVGVAWLAAAVFALHPVHAESVAWIAERKNVLSGCFYLAAGLAYLHFDSLEENSRRRWGFYALSMALFACALLSKTVTATLPAALLLVIYWKRGRIGWRDIALAAPMLLIGALMARLTTQLELDHVGAKGPDWDFILADRLLIAGRAAWFYAGKLIWPHPLIFFYPRWNLDPLAWWQWGFFLGAIALVLAAYLMRRSIGRGPLVGILFFGGNLVPAMGFVNVYPMLYSFVADHFQYLASIGLIVLLLEASRRGLEQLGQPPAALALILPVLGVLTFWQSMMYRDMETLWRTTIARNPTAWGAHTRLAEILEDRDALHEAVIHYATAVQFKPDYAEIRLNYGQVLQRLGRTEEAVVQFKEAVQLRPDYAAAHYNLGAVAAQRQNWPEARAALEQAIKADPGMAVAHFSLARVLEFQGDAPAAIQRYREALRLDSTMEQARFHLSRLERR